ncbi:MAG: hypothetical protein NTY69_04690 [Methylococcales bacterium]|nr:hypothetical protein [Methylococcales bacterium]
MGRIGRTTGANRGLPKNLPVNFTTRLKAMLIKVSEWLRLLGASI